MAGVDAAAPGDVVLLDRGTHPGGVVVPKSKPGLTIRGYGERMVALTSPSQHGSRNQERGETQMSAHVGDRIVVESERAAQASRTVAPAK